MDSRQISPKTSDSAPSGNPSNVADRFADWVEARRQEDGIPGVAVALLQGQETILLAGFGWRDLERNLPVTPQTLFHIGSTQKSMTALLIATLIDEGIVAWDTPAIAIDPDFKLANAESTQTVTLRHLLSMRSGIPDGAEDEFEIENAEAEDLWDCLAEVELLGEPGEVYSYSNLAVSLAGYLAVLATSADEGDLSAGYARLLQERILTPLGMKNSTLSRSRAIARGDRSKSYIFEEGEWVEAETEDFDRDPLAPSGALKASAADMARYLSVYLSGGIAPDGDRLVSAKNLQQTHEPKWGNYAMGWERDRDRGVESLSHEGAYDNFLSIIGIIP